MAVDGHSSEAKLQEAIREAGENCWKIKTLGSFQKSTLPVIEYEPEAYDNGWIPQDEN